MTADNSDYFLVGQENNNILVLGGFLGVVALGAMMVGMTHQDEMRALTMVPEGRYTLLQEELEDAKEKLAIAEQENTELKAEHQGLGGRVSNLRDQVEDLEGQLAEAAARQRQRQIEEEVIRFTELQGNRFQSGSAEMSEQFKSNLRDRVIPSVEELAGAHGRVTVEVFGFTDGVNVGTRGGCSMDTKLVHYNHFLNAHEPTACSNTDLGLLRATSVARQLRLVLRDKNLRNVQVVAYSAGQTLLPTGALAEPGDNGRADQDRRFVEVRFSLR